MRVAMRLFSVFSVMIGLTSCSQHKTPHQKIQPAKIEKPVDSKVAPQVVLTPEARNRLGIESRSFPETRSGVKIIPVSALLYDTKGMAWVFVEPSPRTFHREEIRVLRTRGSEIEVNVHFDDALPVVIQGAAELSGTESGVGK